MRLPNAVTHGSLSYSVVPPAQGKRNGSCTHQTAFRPVSASMSICCWQTARALHGGTWCILLSRLAPFWSRRRVGSLPKTAAALWCVGALVPWCRALGIEIGADGSVNTPTCLMQWFQNHYRERDEQVRVRHPHGQTATMATASGALVLLLFVLFVAVGVVGCVLTCRVNCNACNACQLYACVPLHLGMHIERRC